MDNLIKIKSKGIWVNLIVVLMLLWALGMAFALPLIAAAGFFCVVVVPVVHVVAGKKYGYPLAVVGFAWFVIAIIIFFT